MIWKILTLAFAVTSIVLLALLLKQYWQHYAPYEPRLLGTWVSDKERTQEHFPKHMTEPQKDKLTSLFGKLRVTYTNLTYTTELDGHVETAPYTVLGLDEHSVVIRDDSVQIPDLDVLEMSTFSKIHFDGSDAYWVITEIGGLTEYFRRIRADGT
jgi:hypothetical protein